MGGRRRPGASRRPPPSRGRAAGARLLVRRTGRRAASGRRPGPSQRRSSARTAGAATAATAGWRCAASTPTSVRWSASGPAISKEQADEIIRLASLMPLEGARKVLILDEFHLIQPGGATAAAQDDRGASGQHDVRDPGRRRAARAGHDRLALRPHRLLAVARARAGRRPAGGGGRRPKTRPRRRLRLGATSTGLACWPLDPGLLARRDAFHRLPHSGSTAPGRRSPRPSTSCSGSSTPPPTPLKQRQAEELAVLDRRVEQLGERGSGAAARGAPQAGAAPPPHRRAQGRPPGAGRGLPRRSWRPAAPVTPLAAVGAVASIQEAFEALDRNANESLLLQVLLLRLPTS